MPELVEQMYCSQQIVIPPKFPYILKKYCKAAIKTQPYDLLRWSFEYFSALAENRPPPVKLRLEYPIYSTEGGLTKGCLKVMANQLLGLSDIPIPAVMAAWRGFCLDSDELNRILCLCEVYLRKNEVPFLHFIAVAGGLLTKTLTHTMILLCETLTKEPDGGSAAIPVQDFLIMYKFLAAIDASKDVKYYNGYREGIAMEAETAVEEEDWSVETTSEKHSNGTSSDDICEEGQKLLLTNDRFEAITRLSVRLQMPTIDHLERSPSMERAGKIDRENFMGEGRGRPKTDSSDVSDARSRPSTESKIAEKEAGAKGKGETEKTTKEIVIHVCDEDGNEVPYTIYGEGTDNLEEKKDDTTNTEGTGQAPEETPTSEKERIQNYVRQCVEDREARRKDLEDTFDELQEIVEKFKFTNYDLGMIAGRQMSITSGEFIVQNVEKDIMKVVNDQIAVLPDPDTKKKKAKPEEVAMVREIVEKFIDESLDVIVQENEELEEEEAPIPEVTVVFAVPGIGGPVDEHIVKEFEEYALEVSVVQTDLFMPRNIRHFMCPPLEKYEESSSNEAIKEVPRVGS